MVFNKSVLIYFRSYLWFILLTLATGFITTLACQLVPWSGFFALVMKGIICVIIISSLLIPVWTQSKITYNMVFNKSVLIYFRSYLWFILLTLATGFITTLACQLVPWSGFFALVMKGIICVIIVNVVYLIVFFKTSEFKYLWQVFKPMIEKRITKYSVRR